MKIKQNIFLRASINQVIINFIKYSELLILIPILMRKMGTDYANYLEAVSLFSWLVFLDLNLPNFIVNTLEKINLKRLLKLVFYKIFPLTFILGSIIIFFTEFTQILFLSLLLVSIQISNGIISGYIKKYNGFNIYYKVAINFNLISFVSVILIMPENAFSYLLLKVFLGIFLLLCYLFMLRHSKSNNSESQINIFKYIFLTKEYTTQRFMEYINGNAIGLLLVPINANYALTIYTYKTILNLPVAISNIFVQIYHQTMIEKGQFKKELTFFVIGVTLPLIILTLFLLLGSFNFLINNYFGLSINIQKQHIVILSIWSLFTALNKRFNIKRQIANQSKKAIVYFVIIAVTALLISRISINSFSSFLLLFCSLEFIYLMLLNFNLKKHI